MVQEEIQYEDGIPEESCVNCNRQFQVNDLVDIDGGTGLC